MRPETGVRTAFAILAFGSGALDVATFLRLGNVFASVMTSNLVFVAVAAARHDASLGVHCGVALGGYILGVLAGAAVAGPEQEQGSPGRVTVLLLAEATALAVGAGMWVGTAGRPHGDVQLALLALATLSTGAQGVVARHLGGGGISTTYLTGTLTSLVSVIVRQRGISGADPAAAIVLGAIIAGAGLGALLLGFAPTYVAFVPLGAVSVAAGVSPRACRECGRREASSDRSSPTAEM